MKYKRITPKFARGGSLSTSLDNFYTGGNKLKKYNSGGVLSGNVVSGTLSGAQSGGVVGAVLGMVGGAVQDQFETHDEYVRNQQHLAKRGRQLRQMNENRDRQSVADYDIYGTPNLSYFREGGTIDLTQGADYEVEGEEVVQGGANLESSTPLASDIDLAVGPSHEGGGVLGIGGERVFSDRGSVDPSIVELLSELGIGKVKGKTYADVAEDLGRKKGKMEEKLLSSFTPSNNTAERTIPRIETALDILFESQESEKPEQNDVQIFVKGGQVKPYRRIELRRDGGLLPNRRSNINTLPLTAGITQQDYTFNTPDIISPDTLATPYAADTGVSSQGDGTNNLDWDSVLGQAANLGNYYANRESIRNLRTDVNPVLLPSPVYNYRDRSEAERSAVGRMIRSGQQALGSSSRTVNASNQAALMSQGVEANNRIALQEAQRRDRYNMIYNDQVMRTNAQNVGMINQADNMQRDLENRKFATLPQQARTAYMQGVMGNEYVRQQRRTDKNRLRISALLNDNNDVLTRAASNMGYGSVEELIDALTN